MGDAREAWRLHVRGIAASLLLPSLLLLAWELTVSQGLLPRSQFSRPSDVFSAVIAGFADMTLPRNLAVSLGRLIIGVFSGVVLGALVGTTTVLVASLKKTAAPTLGFLAGLPVVVWMPVWIAVAGIGELFKVGLVAIASFFLAYAVAAVATARANREYLEVAQLFEKKTGEAIVHVYVPAILGQIFVALRLSLAFGWIILFFVEYAVSEPGSEGLGWFVANARQVGRIEEEFAGLVMLGTAAFLLDRLINVGQNHMLSWASAVEDHR